MTSVWPSISPAPASALSTTGSRAAGTTRPTAPSSRAASSRPFWGSPTRPHQPGDDQVAQGVADELLGLEALLEGGGQGRVLLGQRHQALAQVPGGHDVELASQPPRRARRRRPPTPRR